MKKKIRPIFKNFTIFLLIMTISGCNVNCPDVEDDWGTKFVEDSTARYFYCWVDQQHSNGCAIASTAMYLQVIIYSFNKRRDWYYPNMVIRRDYPTYYTILDIAENLGYNPHYDGMYFWEAQDVLYEFYRWDPYYGTVTVDNSLSPFGYWWSSDTYGKNFKYVTWPEVSTIFDKLSKSLDIYSRMGLAYEEYNLYHRERGIMIAFFAWGGTDYSGHALYAYGIYRDNNHQYEYNENKVKFYLYNPSQPGNIEIIDCSTMQEYKTQSIIYDEGVDK